MSAQSTAASLSGTVHDEQRGVLVGAAIALKNLETGQERTTLSDETGDFRVMGLPPGRYEMRIGAPGFAPLVGQEIQLRIAEEAETDITMRVASLVETTSVVADAPITDPSTTALGRTFTTAEIEELPIAGRDFNNLALLTPGILTDHSTGRGPSTTIAASGQIGRNNTFLIDGLTTDEHVGGMMRGGVSLDAIKEFMVLSNNFNAEYGFASGAVISVLTRSGTNQLAGRGFYYHRDDRWDATDGAARLAVPPPEKTTLDGKIVGGFLGGPLVRDRVFYFWSAEHTVRNTEHIVTSSALKTFRPDASPRLPARFRDPQLFGRADFTLNSRNALALRYRLDRVSETNQYNDSGPVGLISPERRNDVLRRDQDFVVLDSHVLGSSKLNEFRFQFARRRLDNDVRPYCSGCPAENRPSILLGKAPVVPVSRTEDRWQFVDALTLLVPDTLGDHTLKAGVDVSVIDGENFGPAGFDGIWRFNTDTPFSAVVAATYPTQYVRFIGDPLSDLNSRLYTLYLQDQWKPVADVTLNLGVRWDYEETLGVSRDRDNVAPRLGVTYDPWKNGRTVFRGGYGIYYDSVLYRALNNSEAGSRITQIIINQPGYPDPYGPNPSRTGDLVTVPPSVNRFAGDIRTPYTQQTSAGVRHVRGRLAVTADWVWARGYNLLRTRDINYPDLTNPNPRVRPRPDPNFGRVRVRETEGRSWYRALLVGLQKPHSDRHSYGVAYTLSRSERDTEDWEFIAQDQRDYDAERGPSSSDVRHRLSTNVNLDLPLGVQFTTVLTAQSPLPYNVTTGNDDNGDGEMATDRPAGVSRNSARGADFWQMDARLSKLLRSRRGDVELLAEAFNLANRRNWTDFVGNLRSPAFGKPSDAASPRQVQVGIRVSF